MVAEREQVTIDPDFLESAGVAVMKKTCRIYRERGYRLRLLSAAFRNHMHWSEFIGGDVVISPPCAWQKRFNELDIKIENRMDVPVNLKVVDALQDNFADFRRAYEETGMRPEDFDAFGSTVRTMRQFIPGYENFDAVVRDFILPNPDVK